MKKDKNEIKYILWGLSPLFVSIGIVTLFFLIIYIVVNFQYKTNINIISEKVEKELDEYFCIDFDNDCKVIEGEKVRDIFDCEYFIRFETSWEGLETMVSNGNWERRSVSPEDSRFEYDGKTYEVYNEFYAITYREDGISSSGNVYYWEDEDKLQCIFHGVKSNINQQ